MKFEEIKVGEYFTAERSNGIVWQKIMPNPGYPAVNCICVQGELEPLPMAAIFDENELHNNEKDVFVICDKEGNVST